MREFRADGKASGFAIDLGVPVDLRHQLRATKIHCRGAAAVTVINGFGGARIDLHAENRHLIVLSCLLVHLLRRGVLAGSTRLSGVRRSGIQRGRRIILREHDGQEHDT